MKRNFLTGLLFLIPLIFHSQMGILMNPFVYSQIAVIVLSSCFILLMTKMPLTVRIFYAWCLVSTFVSHIPHFSAIAFIVVTLFLLLYKFILNFTKEDLHHCFKIIALICAIQVFWIFAQVVNKDFVMNVGRKFAFTYGTMGNHNLLGAFFLFNIIPMYHYRKWSILLPIIGIFYAHAAASIYALFGGVLFYILFNSKISIRLRALIIISSFIPIVLFFQLVDNPLKQDGNGRFPVWKQVLKKTTKENMLVGYGLGLFQYEVWTKDGATYEPSIQRTIWPQAHNVYIQAWREQGLFGMISIVLIPLALFIMYLRNRTEETLLWMSGVVMICLNAFGNFPDRNFTLALLIVFVLASARIFMKEKSLFI